MSDQLFQVDRVYWNSEGHCSNTNVQFLLDRKVLVPVEPDYKASGLEIEEVFGISPRLALHLAERFHRATFGSRDEMDSWLTRLNEADVALKGDGK